MKKFIKKYALLALSSLCALGVGTGIASLATAERANGFTEVTYDEAYSLGESVEIDQRFYIVGGQEIPCQSVVSLPGGASFQGNKLEISSAGRYTVTYTAYVGNSVYTDVVYFNGLGGIATIRGEKPSAQQPEYVENYYGGKSGIAASIKQGESLFFNQSVDLSGLGKAQNILTFFHKPNNVGNRDAELVVTLTDVYNPDNYVRLRFRYYNEETKAWSYVSASFPESDEVGLRFHDGSNQGDSSVLFNGTYYQLDKNQLGTTIKYALTGEMQENSVDKLSVSFDNTDKTIYVNGTIVADLDNPLLYNDTLFKGFTTGEVYVSLQGVNYTNKYLNLCVTELSGADLQKNEFLDTVAPVIDVDTLGYETLPTALVGYKYPVFNATATDLLDGNCEVGVKVYKNYYSSQRVFVSLVDNAFTPTTEGDYYLVYTARDATGNSVEKVVQVVAKKEARVLIVEAINPITQTKAGEETVLFENYTLSGALGNCDVQAYVQKVGDANVTALEGNTFTPYMTGAYKLLLKATDYIGDIWSEYAFEVTGADSLVFIGEPAMEKYFIKGQSYVLPSYSAYTLSNVAPKAEETKAYISEDGGAYVQVTGARYTVQANESVKVKYQADGVSYETAEIPVQDLNFGVRLRLEDTFAHRGFTATAQSDKILYTANYATIGQSGAMEFVNSILVSKFDFSFELDGANANYKKVSLVLTDVEDSQNVLKVNYYNENGKLMFGLEGSDKKYTVSSNFNAVTPISFRYLNDTLECTGNEGLKAEVLKGFEGFAGKLAFLRVEIDGVQNLNGRNATIGIKFINGQIISSYASDDNAPSVLHTQHKGEVLLGQVFTVDSVFAKDVLDNYVTVSYSVKAPDGKYAVSVDGVTLDENADYSRSYQIQANSLGRYRVTITAEDSSLNRNVNNSYLITITEREKPTITLSKDYAITAKVGETVSVASFTVMDNIDGDKCKSYVFVKNAKGVLSSVEDGRVTVASAGVYEIIYVCYDSCNNMSTVSYKIQVK